MTDKAKDHGNLDRFIVTGEDITVHKKKTKKPDPQSKIENKTPSKEG